MSGKLNKRCAFAFLLAVTLCVHSEDKLGLETLIDDVPPFELVAAAGGPGLTNDNLLGKTVLLHFWATWCEPCKKELPALQQLAAELDDTHLTVVLVAIDTVSSPAQITAFARELGVQLPIYVASDGAISDSFWGWGLPVTYLLDKQGRFMGRLRGPRPWADAGLRSALVQLAQP